MAQISHLLEGRVKCIQTYIIQFIIRNKINLSDFYNLAYNLVIQSIKCTLLIINNENTTAHLFYFT